MAKAKIDLVLVEQVVVEKHKAVVLTLTEEEASALGLILGYVAGQGDRREHLTSIVHSLRDVGVDWSYYNSGVTGRMSIDG